MLAHPTLALQGQKDICGYFTQDQILYLYCHPETVIELLDDHHPTFNIRSLIGPIDLQEVAHSTPQSTRPSAVSKPGSNSTTHPSPSSSTEPSTNPAHKTPLRPRMDQATPLLPCLSARCPTPAHEPENDEPPVTCTPL